MFLAKYVLGDICMRAGGSPLSLFWTRDATEKKFFSFSFAERWYKDFPKRQRRKSYFISSVMVWGEGGGTHVYSTTKNSRHVTVPSSYEKKKEIRQTFSIFIHMVAIFSIFVCVGG